MRRATMTLFLMAALLAAGLGLQVFLSHRASRWPGLVLPGICVLYSLVLCLNVMAGPGAVPAAVSCLLLGNIPTLVLLAVYAACREGRKRRSDVEKMNIQDL